MKELEEKKDLSWAKKSREERKRNIWIWCHNSWSTKFDLFFYIFLGFFSRRRDRKI